MRYKRIIATALTILALQFCYQREASALSAPHHLWNIFRYTVVKPIESIVEFPKIVFYGKKDYEKRENENYFKEVGEGSKETVVSLLKGPLVEGPKRANNKRKYELNPEHKKEGLTKETVRIIKSIHIMPGQEIAATIDGAYESSKGLERVVRANTRVFPGEEIENRISGGVECLFSNNVYNFGEGIKNLGYIVWSD